MIPVFVCVKATKTALVEWGNTFPAVERAAEPIGYLQGFEAKDIDDFGMVQREVIALGLKAKFLVRAVKAAHLCQGALIAFAVEVPTWETANALPGFVPLGYWSGAYLRPPDVSSVVFTEEDFFEQTKIKRLLVSDYYTEFEPPEYEDGVCFCSMIPLGRLGGIYFFEDDPLHFYLTNMGEIIDKAERIALLRRFRDAVR